MHKGSWIQEIASHEFQASEVPGALGGRRQPFQAQSQEEDKEGEGRQQERRHVVQEEFEKSWLAPCV